MAPKAKGLLQKVRRMLPGGFRVRRAVTGVAVGRGPCTTLVTPRKRGYEVKDSRGAVRVQSAEKAVLRAAARVVACAERMPRLLRPGTAERLLLLRARHRYLKARSTR